MHHMLPQEWKDGYVGQLSILKLNYITQLQVAQELMYVIDNQKRTHG